MLAIAIIPGRIYRVRAKGLDITVLARHGCDAICAAIRLKKAGLI